MGLFRSLIKSILDKLLPSRLAVVEKAEITDMLVDMQKRVEQGTEKIDNQIPVLQKILKDIERLEGPPPSTSLQTKLSEYAKKTGASPEEARQALVDAANEAYPPNSPKRIMIDDDETLEAYIDTREQMGMKLDLLEDIVDRVEPSPEVKKKIEEIAKARDYKNIFETKDTRIPDRDALEFTKFSTDKEESAFDLIRKGIEKGQIKEAGMSVADEVEEALKINKQRQADLKALEDKMADPKNIDKMTKPGGLADLMQEVQDDKVIPFKKPDKKAMGGRVGMQLGGGIMKALMSLMRKGDEKQIKGVIRDPKTDLERLKDTDPKQPTIREMEDLPGKLGYDERNKMKLQKLVEREKVRAILADQLGVDPKDIPEENIDMAIAEGMGMFSQGGGVGSLFKRKAK
jgi:hypothetical protein